MRQRLVHTDCRNNWVIKVPRQRWISDRGDPAELATRAGLTTPTRLPGRGV